MYCIIITLLVLWAEIIYTTDIRIFPSKQTRSSKYFAIVNEQLNIYVDGYSVMSAFCYRSYRLAGMNAYTPHSLRLATVTDSIIHVSNVTDGMSTSWDCDVLLRDIKKQDDEQAETTHLQERVAIKSLFLNLHVKGAKSLEISVNGSELPIVRTNLSVSYDGEAIYYYEEGDELDIGCKKNRNQFGSVHLGNFTEGMKFERIPDVMTSAGFYLHLTSMANGSYIDCVYSSVKPDDEYTYRIKFISKTLSSGRKTKVSIATNSNSKSVAIGCSVGAIFFIILSCMLYWNLRRRTIKHIENQHESPSEAGHSNPAAHQSGLQYDECYHEHLNDIGPEPYYYSTPFPEWCPSSEHHYMKVDYSSCKPKAEVKPMGPQEYAEPYVI